MQPAAVAPAEPADIPTIRARHRQPPPALLGLVVLLAGLAGSLAELYIPSLLEGHDSGIWAAVSCSVVVGWGAYILATNKVAHLGPPRWLRLGPVFSLYYSLVFGIFSLAWLSPQSGIAALINPSEIAPALCLTTVGLAAWAAGYVLGVPPGLRNAGRSFVAQVFPGDTWTFRFPSVPMVIFMIGIGAQLYQLRSAQYGYLASASAALSSPSGTAQITALIADFAQLGLVLAAIDAFSISRNFRSRLVFRIMLLVSIGTGLYSGNKQPVVVAILSVLLVAVFCHRFSRRSLLIGIVAILVVFPITTAYRASIRNPTTKSASPYVAASALATTLGQAPQYLTPRSLLVDSPSAIASRLREIDNVAIIRQQTPAVLPYQPWTALIEGPLVDWVPRLLWHSKPVNATARDFSLQYYRLPPSVETGSAVTIPGWLYMHGGMVPLIVGMILFGSLTFWIDVAVDPAPDRRRLLLFVPLFTLTIFLESDTTSLLLGMVGVCLTAAIVSRLAFVGRSASLVAESNES